MSPTLQSDQRVHEETMDSELVSDVRPYFSIITPTLQRLSLAITCDSVNKQSFTNWEHIVQVDCENKDESLLSVLQHERRQFMQCLVPHRNFGNTCRHNAWAHVRGEYVIYLDDDNWFADDDVLQDIHDAIRYLRPIAVMFPITAGKERFFNYPPRKNYVDTANVVFRSDVAQWPDGPEYDMDGIFIERIWAEHLLYVYHLEKFRSIVVKPFASEGRT